MENGNVLRPSLWDLLLEQCWFAGNGRQTKVLSLSTSEGNYNQQGDLVAVL